MIDILIKNGIVIDGTSSANKKYEADIAIIGGKIKSIESNSSAKAQKIIDASGMYIAPGFIDIQNHSDVYGTLFNAPVFDSMLQQGVTTVICGNCGASLAPLGYREGSMESIQRWSNAQEMPLNWNTLAEFLSELERKKLGINFGTLTGHSTIRHSVIKTVGAQTTDRELEVMKKMLEETFEQGSFGMSSGLVYSYAQSVSANELIELAAIVKKHGGLYSTHLRNEGDLFVLALNEALETCRKSEVSLKISHLKVMYKHNWSEAERALEILDKFNESDFDVNFDIYPYTATHSALYIVLPQWSTRKGKKELLKMIKDKEQRSNILKEMRERPYEYEKVMIAQAPLDKTFIGKTIDEIAENQNTSPEEAVVNMLAAADGQVSCYTFTLKEENTELLLQHPLSIIASDGGGYNLDFGKTGQLVHPRCFGTFPRVLGRYVRERKVLNWEQAIHKMTGKPAKKIGILDERGTIQINKAADITIFNPKTIADKATYQNPYQFPIGIEYVIVNGQVALEKGNFTGITAGKVLRKK